MASPKTRKSKTGTASRASDIELLQSQRRTQQDVDPNVQARDMLAASKKRRAAKRNAINEKRLNGLKDAQTRADTLFNAHKSKVAKIRKAQWDKLATLNKKRHDVEAQIISSMKLIERLTINMAGELEVVFTGRAEDFKLGEAEKEKEA